MTDHDGPAASIDVRRRLAAAAALLLGLSALLVAVASLRGDVGRALLAAVLLLLVVALAWSAATRTGRVRAVAATLAVLGVAGFVVLVLRNEKVLFFFKFLMVTSR